MRTQWMVISALLFALVTAIFAVINVDKVQVNLGFVQTQSPLILVILISTLLGGLTVFLFAIFRQLKLYRTIKLLEKRIAELESATPAGSASYSSAFGEEAPSDSASNRSALDTSLHKEP